MTMSVVYWVKDDSCKNPLTDGYIGITKDPKGRLRSHRKHHRNVPENATMEILFTGTRDECFEQEKRYRPSKSIGWNNAPGGQQGYLEGFSHSPLTKARLKAAWTDERKSVAAKWKAEQNKMLKGQKRPRQSEAMTGVNNPIFGQTRSDETKRKISLANLGKKPPNKQELYCIKCRMRAPLSILNKYHRKCKEP